MSNPSRYAPKLVELGVDKIDDLIELDDDDWRSESLLIMALKHGLSLF